MTNLELEAGKMELIREIANIDSNAMLENVRKRLRDVLKPTFPRKANDSKRLTKLMIKKYAGVWDDNRSSDEIIDDIYAARFSNKDNNISLFDE